MKYIERFLKKAVEHYYTQVVACPESRVWYHNLYQQLESGGEVPDLDTCRGKLNDEWIEPLFDKHQDDENRHAQMWLDLLTKRNTYNPDDIPGWANTVAAFCNRGWLATVDKLSKDKPIHQSELITMFAGIHALEHLAIGRFQLMSDLHREIDPEISQLLDVVIKDEKFHQAYTKEAVLRLGKRHNCLEFAKQCLDEGVVAYQKYALSLMPNYVDYLGKKGKGAKFSRWFLVLNQLLKVYKFFKPQLTEPPALPKHIAQKVAEVEQRANMPAMQMQGA
ncbi:ferritin-like domain-containing protein [Aliikangiella sp. IMCC44359]|uniref:ferritin-like domain-containing protein n=1 Tax=Aliikangiella sp. IMCC44359 TaxID=3459125 RepID=UPI00403AC276